MPLDFVNFKKDAFIVVEGEQKADQFFIIRQGFVRLVKEVEVLQDEKDTLGVGDFIAVVSTMSSHRHIETAQALTDVSLISIKKELYGDIIQSNTGIAIKIIQQFSKRMRYLNEALTRLTLKKNAEEDVSHLFQVAEYYNKREQYNQAYSVYDRYMKYCPQGENFEQAREQKTEIAIHVYEDNLKFKANGMTRTYPKDSLFFSESEPGDELFIIQKGSVKITKIVDNNEVLLAILKPGDIFGEMALLEDRLRSASAIAHEECVVIVVNKANFETMAKSQPQIAVRLTTLLAERIWSLYRQLASTLIVEPLGRMYDALLLHLEKNRVPLDQNEPYTFDFGTKELINMVGLSQEEGQATVREMLHEPQKMQVRDDKLYCPDIRLIPKEVRYYQKMDTLAQQRKGHKEKKDTGNS
jgi:CRP-like cAMP-binding protein